MKRDPRTEVVSVRLTKAERDRLEAMGGPTALLRRALDPAPFVPVRSPRACTGTQHSNGSWSFVWSDGSVGMTWPPVCTSMP